MLLNKKNSNNAKNVPYKSLFGLGIFVTLFFLQYINCEHHRNYPSNKESNDSNKIEIKKTKKGGEKQVQELIQQVLNGNPSAPLLAKEIGASANIELQKLAKHSDEEIREIALMCLIETGEKSSIPAFIDAISDEDSQIRAIALKGLYHHFSYTNYNTLIQVYETNADTYVRQQVMLIIGKLPIQDKLNDLKKRCYTEKNAEALEGCIVALARHNDEYAKNEFIKQLHISRGISRARYLEYCEYINSPWLIKPLALLLDDKTPMIRVGVDARPEMIEYLRACDLAANLIASILGQKFSFEINQATNYDDNELTEIKKYVQNLP